MKTNFSKFVFTLVVTLAVLFKTGYTSFGAVFTVTPAAVSNTYSGFVTLSIANIPSGDTVVVQKFLDANANGVIDSKDWLVQQFNVTDGTNFMIGGVTNINVPGDRNPASGAITSVLNFKGGDFTQSIIGRYLYKISSPVGHFAPVTNLFTVTNFPYAQGFTGSVVSKGTSTTLPNAMVILFHAPSAGSHGPGNPVGGTVANNSGHYSIQLPPGTYMPVAFQSNYVADFGTAPVLTLGSQTINTNLSLMPATASISGRMVDALNPTIGLPGVFGPVLNNSGLATIAFTDTNGNFTARVTAGSWSIGSDDTGLIVHGYVGYESGTNVNAGDTGVIGPFYQATAMFYGSVKDIQGNPIPGIDLFAYDNNNNIFQSDGFSDPNGNYAVGVVGGLGGGDPWNVQIGDSSLTNYVFSQPAFSQNGGTNLAPGQALKVNFTAIPATNHLAGNVQFDGTNVAGVLVYANATISNVSYNVSADTDNQGNYSLNVANGTWTVGVSCSGGNDSLDNVLGSGSYQCPNNQNVFILNNGGTANFIVQPAGTIVNQLSGYVTDVGGGPVAGVNIYASNGNGGSYSTASDYSGFYSFNVTNGNWDVSVDCGGLNLLGYQCVSTQTVNIANGNGTANFIVHPLQTQSIILTSDANTTAASQNGFTALDTGDPSGLTFQPVMVGSYGTFTPVPPRAPANTEVVQIPPADGESGFFKINFVLPQAYRDIQLAGVANADDFGRVFLNGHPLTASLTNSDPAPVSEGGNVAFSTTNAAWFVPGTNEFLVSDWNSGGGPSGAAFYASISYIVPPALGSPAKPTSGKFQMLLNGEAGQNYTIQMSTNLSSTNWTTLLITNNPAAGSYLLTDPNATNQQRFYRVLIGP